MREQHSGFAVFVGVLIIAEGVRSVVLLIRHRSAAGRGYLGVLLVLAGASVLLRIPQADATVTRLTGIPDLGLVLRGWCTVGTAVGSAGILKVTGYTWLRTRYVLLPVVAAAAFVVVAARLAPNGPEGFVAGNCAVWFCAVIPMSAYLLAAPRMVLIGRDAGAQAQVGSYFTVAGCAATGGGLAVAVVALDLPSGGHDLGGVQLMAHSCGGVLLVLGSCSGEVARALEVLRRRRERRRIRRLWWYVEPLRQTMVGVPAGGVAARELIDICDTLVLAHQQNDDRVRERAKLVAEAASVPAQTRDDFIDAVVLRAAIENAGQQADGGGTAPETRAKFEETEPVACHEPTFRAEIAALAKLVLGNRVVRRTAFG
ncbi:hypothetical protein GCM10022222_84670 [Amycolatopsis ultiminotia]|uniref:Uncharacterized protein n=1 Tax=Amycolatopsis ultiminotia TaxID=543629 RepID=A0ABP6YT01_9PSEU